MKKKYHIYVLTLLSLTTSIALHAMQQQQSLLELHKKLPLPEGNIMAICFNKDLSRYACAYQQHTGSGEVKIMNTQGITYDETAVIGYPIQSLCFNKDAHEVGVLTTNGKVRRVYGDHSVGGPYDSDTIVFTSVGFVNNRFIAGTKDGALFEIEDGKPCDTNKIFQYQVREFIPGLFEKMPAIYALDADKSGTTIALAGGDNKHGFVKLIPYQQQNGIASKEYQRNYCSSNVTKIKFDESGDWLVFAIGTDVLACSLINDNYRNILQTLYKINVTEVIFGSTRNDIFIGRDNGQVHFSYNDGGDNLLQWDHPIVALAYHDQMLAVATLHKAALYKLLLKIKE